METDNSNKNIQTIKTITITIDKTMETINYRIFSKPWKPSAIEYFPNHGNYQL